ncbi:MAG: hypothetical protein JSS27_18110 [Planctomycetes bacterium]|nr:hypothetical protein [Planctomycetota bacterium]
MRLPELTEFALERLSACATFHVADRAVLEDLAKRPGGGVYVQADGGLIDGKKTLVRLIIEPSDADTGHFHMDYGFAEDFARRGMDDLSAVSIDRLSELVEPFFGQSVEVFLQGAFLWPVESLPRRGIVTMLLGIEMESCGSAMRLKAAEMEIESDSFSSVSWKQIGECLQVTIEAETATNISADYLVQLSGFIFDGFDCFILESSGAKTEHASTERLNPLPRKLAGQ